MASTDVKFALIFLFQIVVGILGNFWLFYHFMSHYLRGYGAKSTGLILRHLTLINSLVILSRGIPETMTAFELKSFLSDFGCKVVFFVHRVARGMSMDTTCLLSVFQAITISPWSSRHRHQVQHIHRTKVPPTCSPEIRATQSILVLVSTFVSFYTFSSIIYIYFSVFYKTCWWLMTTSALINSGFPTACPFILLSHNHCVSRFFSVCMGRNTHFPHLIREI
uniref:Vomeronasal type-1 receptor n=1 Tax=Felis catus TaxID=9685 RepID=A0ABI7ZSZ2_FELCA